MSKTFSLSIRKIEKIFTLECPSCGHKMIYSPEIGVEEDGGKTILTKSIPYSKVVGSKVCLNCGLVLDFDELLIIKDALEMAKIISSRIKEHGTC